MEMNTKISQRYCVAGLGICVNMPEKVAASGLLKSYEPFKTDEDGENIFTLDVEIGELPAVGPLWKVCNDEAPFLWLYKKQDGLDFGFSFTKDTPAAILEFNGATGRLTIVRKRSFREVDGAISNAMMLMYAYNSVWKDALMLHASVTMNGGKGYLFLGKSGTGKSTHSQLWLDNIPGCELLNDDNPVIRVIDGVPTVFGTPWSGKTPCYKDKNVPVGGIVRLSQAPFNKIHELDIFEAYAALMPSCSSMKWDLAWADAEHRTLEAVLSTCRCWHLECLPDADAAHTCFNAVTGATAE